MKSSIQLYYCCRNLRENNEIRSCWFSVDEDPSILVLMDIFLTVNAPRPPARPWIPLARPSGNRTCEYMCIWCVFNNRYSFLGIVWFAGQELCDSAARIMSLLLFVWSNWMLVFNDPGFVWNAQGRGHERMKFNTRSTSFGNLIVR